MDCPICFTEISAAATGQVLLVCGHTFHFRCLASWFVTQKGVSSCPCCRREMSHYEDLPTTEEVGESDAAAAAAAAPAVSDDEDDEDDEFGQQIEEELNWLHDLRNCRITYIYHRDPDRGLLPQNLFLALNIYEGEPIPLFQIDTIFIRGESLPAKICAVNESLAGIKRFQALWRGYAVRASRV